MDLLPEQIAVMEYLKERGTEADAATLLASFRATVDEAYHAFSIVPPALRLAEPGPGKWSAQEILDHVLECHRCAPAQLQRLLRGEQGDEAIRAFVQSPNPRAHPWRSMLHEFRAVHQAMIEAADAFDAEAPLNVGAPIELVTRLRDTPRTQEIEWTAYLDWKAYLAALRKHLQQHVKQLERTLEDVQP